MARSAHHCPPLFLVLAMTICCIYGIANAMDMDNMPDDPVSGEMVMNRAYNFELLNGPCALLSVLSIAKEGLTVFDCIIPLQNMGLKGIVSASATHARNGKEKSLLCPVCGMTSSITHGPEVVMLHGHQAVHTCSMTHARQVYNDILSFQSLKESEAAVKEQNFCSGPGTTMLNGFSLSDTSTPCILLWFPGWVLDSRLRYIFGGILVALVAIFNEYLLQLRCVLRKDSSVKHLMSVNVPHATESARLLRSTAQSMPLADSCGPAWFRTLSLEMQHGVHSLLHGITIFFAYMLMLVSMTYDFTLLLWVVGGYVFGHYIFGERCEAPLCSEEMESNFP